MYRFIVIICVLLLPLTSISLDYSQLKKHFLDEQPELMDSYKVNNLMINKNGVQMILEKGTIYKLKSLDSINTYYFEGSGMLILNPQSFVEYKQIERVFNSKRFTKEFNTLLLTDNFGLINSLNEGNKTNSSDVSSSFYTKFTKCISDIDSKNFNVNFGLSNLNKGFDNFAALFEFKDDGNRYFLEFSEFERYQIQLSYVKEEYGSSHYYLQNILKYNNSEQQVRIEELDFMDIISTKTDVKINSSLYINAIAEIEFMPQRDSLQWISFNLNKKFNLNSIKYNGKDLKYDKGDGGYTVFIKMPETLKRDESYKITFDYEGDIIDRIRDITIIEHFGKFYPNNGFYELKKFDMTFEVPDNYTFSASGRLVEEEDLGDKTKTRWVVDEGSIHVGFNIGPYKETEFKGENTPEFVIQSINTDQIESIKRDILQAYDFYSNLIGELEHDKIYVTEIPYNHGQAFPGFLHLSYWTYIGSSSYGDHEMFVSHEMAHQWWGIGVVPDSEGDVWLSEGFSEYFSLMYLQLSSNEKELFFDQLEKKKEKLINSFERSTSAGPIALGTRLNIYNYDDYQSITYDKGAWVLHMLRNMLIDLQSMNEDKFMKIMKTFYNKYKGEKASTYDFMNTCNEVLGIDLNWFFKQWVFDYKIPTYHFAHKVEKNEDGKYEVLCRVWQTGVDDDFGMPIPIGVKFDEDKGTWRTRVNVTGKEKVEFKLPAFDEEPDEIIFNYLSSVLCKVEKKDY